LRKPRSGIRVKAVEDDREEAVPVAVALEVTADPVGAPMTDAAPGDKPP
jgi:hypothetical protein